MIILGREGFARNGCPKKGGEPFIVLQADCNIIVYEVIPSACGLSVGNACQGLACKDRRTGM